MGGGGLGIEEDRPRVLLSPLSDKAPKQSRGSAPGPLAGWMGMVEARTFRRGGWAVEEDRWLCP